MPCMANFWVYFYEYYYLVLILQAFCVYHCVRKGNQQNWIWIIVFLPAIGCIIYLFTEVLKKRDVSNIQAGVAQVVNPGGKIKQLEKKLQFSDTFTNRVALADAYMGAKMYQQAVDLYESALTGVFADNEHAVKQLIEAYHYLDKYEEITKLAPRVVKTMNFSQSAANLYYAFALEKTGQHHLAEKEYKEMNHRFSNFEARYHYGSLLLRHQRAEESLAVFQEMLDEGEHMNRKELGNGKVWISKAREEWSKLVNQFHSSK